MFESGQLRAGCALICLTLLSSAISQVEKIEHARVYARGDNPSKPLFSFERRVRSEESSVITDVEFHDLSGRLAATEQVRYHEGKVVRYELVQHQVDERYTLTVNGDQARFEILKNGSLSVVQQSWTPQTITIDQIPPLVESNWSQIQAGESVSFRLVALNRARIVGFEVGKPRRITYRGSPAIQLRMQASSFFVRWLAPEVELIFTSDGRKLLESRGPLPLKVKEGDHWEDLDARLVWDD